MQDCVPYNDFIEFLKRQGSFEEKMRTDDAPFIHLLQLEDLFVGMDIYKQ